MNVDRNKLDGFIADIVGDWHQDFPYWLGSNPDVGYDELGKLIFKSRKPGPDFGKVWSTDFDISNYIND